MVEIPPPATPAESRIVQAVADRARTADPGQDPLQIDYVPRWEIMADVPTGWLGKTSLATGSSG